MGHKTYKSFGTRETPQSQPIPGSSQMQNNAGGFAWAVDDWVRLDRFLILGSEGGTYYVDQQELTARNANAVLRCIKADGPRVVNRIVQISESGRAAKNDPALFALAMCTGLGDKATRALAMDTLPRVARIGTHLFHFCEYVQQFRGWGQLLMRGVSNWYTSKDIDALAYQAIKYRQRDGWTHRDVLRKAHATGSAEHNALFDWITKGNKSENLPHLVMAFEEAQAATDAKRIVNLITEHNLPRETIPTQFLNEVSVWDALLQKMPLTAMVRNLGKMTNIGLLKPMSDASKMVVARLGDQEYILKARVHPLGVLTALLTYRSGHGTKGKLSWDAVRSIVDALDGAFYLSFGNVVPTNKNLMLGIDVSGSMSWSNIGGVQGLTPRVAAAAMALVTANVEKNYELVGFSHKLVPITISPRQRLDDVANTISRIPMGGTDCSLPMKYALENGINADAFFVYTDSETWYGDMHPSQALNTYRQKTGIAAKLGVIGMVSNGFTIADPNDAGMMDVVGFDTATPNILSDFARQ